MQPVRISSFCITIKDLNPIVSWFVAEADNPFIKKFITIEG